MAFRSTAFDPMEGQQLRANDPSVDFATMEMNLAKEMARLKIVDEKKKREIEKICAESDELKELQSKIKAAYLNKERSAQITETQFRQQQELVSFYFSLIPTLAKRCPNRHGVSQKKGTGGYASETGRSGEDSATVQH